MLFLYTFSRRIKSFLIAFRMTYLPTSRRYRDEIALFVISHSIRDVTFYGIIPFVVIRVLSFSRYRFHV